MAFARLQITPSEDGKGRAFSAALLAYATADTLWPGGSADTDTRRPVWLMFAASGGEAAPFLANLRKGQRAIFLDDVPPGGRRKGPGLELLRSARYAFATQRFAEGAVVTAFLPDLVRHDPGMVDPEGIAFVLLPPRAELPPHELARALAHARALGVFDTRERDEALCEDDVAALAPLATPFVTFLDRRTRAPLLPDPRFHLQLLLACLEARFATRSCADPYGFGKTSRLGFVEFGVEAVGLQPGLAMRVGHAEFEELLARQVTLFFQKG